MAEVIKVEDCGENIGDYDIPIHNAIIIPKEATNGDMFKAMFPVLEVEIEGDQVTFWIDEYRWLSFRLDWWNAPYKGVK